METSGINRAETFILRWTTSEQQEGKRKQLKTVYLLTIFARYAGSHIQRRNDNLFLRGVRDTKNRGALENADTPAKNEAESRGKNTREVDVGEGLLQVPTREPGYGLAFAFRS